MIEVTVCIPHSPLLCEITNRKEKVYWESFFATKNYFLLHLLWQLCPETYVFYLEWMKLVSALHKAFYYF